MLYLIEILHQTTTDWLLEDAPACCILSKFYIKPQLSALHCLQVWRCILSKFYIKPQLRLERELARCSCILSKFYIKPQPPSTYLADCLVVSYRNSTSNHNPGRCLQLLSQLYLIEILHQTTTVGLVFALLVCCILSKFYIKPQLQNNN